jgi:hypothetical protein
MYTPPHILKWCMASESGFNSRNAFAYIRGSYSSENIPKSRWLVHLRWAGTSKKQALSTVFDPQQPLERDATEPHIWPNVYVADALLREPIRIVRAQPEQTVAWPKHADASCSHGTRHVQALSSREIYYRSRDHPNAHELTNHIRHLSPAPGLRSPGAPEKALRMLCGIVPVSPTGAKGSLPRIL